MGIHDKNILSSGLNTPPPSKEYEKKVHKIKMRELAHDAVKNDDSATILRDLQKQVDILDGIEGINPNVIDFMLARVRELGIREGVWN